MKSLLIALGLSLVASTAMANHGAAKKKQTAKSALVLKAEAQDLIQATRAKIRHAKKPLVKQKLRVLVRKTIKLRNKAQRFAVLSKNFKAKGPYVKLYKKAWVQLKEAKVGVFTQLRSIKPFVKTPKMKKEAKQVQMAFVKLKAKVQKKNLLVVSL